MKRRTDEFKVRAEQELKQTEAKALLSVLLEFGALMREQAMNTFPDPAAATRLGAAIRGEVLARLPELLEQFERRATEHGAKVIWARDDKEACDIVVQIAKQRGIQYVTKGKSMVNDELGINDALNAEGVTPYETDLGEFIVQQLNRPPYHIVGPAINIPVQEISDLFMEKADMKKPTTDPAELGYAARLFLRNKFRHVEMGITGVNMAVAETGTIINVENEGNIRLSKSSPKTQVSIMSMEKVVPTMGDALHMMRLLTRHCLGQKITSYVTFDSGPKKADEVDGPEELIIIIVDNGRSKIYADPKTRQVLRCIRCGACLVSCPVYAKIGGYPYGWVYSGPIGQVLTPLLTGLDRTRDLYRACTLCGSCKKVCPAGIDHPSMLLRFRAREKHPFGEARFFDLWALGVTSAWRWRLGTKRLRAMINKYAEDGVISKTTGGGFEGWFRCRDLPIVPDKSFRELIRQVEQDEEQGSQ